jgi:hypothetical protein
MQESMTLKIQELNEESRVLQVSRRRAIAFGSRASDQFTVECGQAFAVSGRPGLELVS